MLGVPSADPCPLASPHILCLVERTACTGYAVQCLRVEETHALMLNHPVKSRSLGMLWVPAQRLRGASIRRWSTLIRSQCGADKAVVKARSVFHKNR